MEEKIVAFICPSCGFIIENKFGDTDIEDQICSCCGIHFGYDDAAGGDTERGKEIYKEWRKKWVDGGMNWWSADISRKPKNWNPEEQLKNVPEEFK